MSSKNGRRKNNGALMIVVVLGVVLLLVAVRISRSQGRSTTQYEQYQVVNGTIDRKSVV